MWIRKERDNIGPRGDLLRGGSPKQSIAGFEIVSPVWVKFVRVLPVFAFMMNTELKQEQEIGKKH